MHDASGAMTHVQVIVNRHAFSKLCKLCVGAGGKYSVDVSVVQRYSLGMSVWD